MPKTHKKSAALTTTPDTLIVAGDSSLTPIGIAPNGSQYLSNNLTVTMTTLPSDRTIFLPGMSTDGTALSSDGPNSMPPVTTAASLSVAANSAPTAIGIAAPTDPNYSASQLVVKVTGLPTDGTVLLSDGVTAVSNEIGRASCRERV